MAASATIGRLGYLGIGLESTPGTPVTVDEYINYTDISLRGHHEPIEVIGTTSSRYMDRSSVTGKKWAEGDISVDLDTNMSGYLWKMALGNEVLTTGTPNNHEFYTTTSGNTPKTATMFFGRQADDQRYSYGAINELTLEVSDGLATLSASIMADFPSSVAAQAPTVTSGTVFAFPNFEMRLGDDLADAAGASATPVNEFSLTINNNLEVIHQTGSSTIAAIRSKSLQVTGNYTVFFENEVDKNAYYSLNKRAMEIKLTGNANEELRIRIPRFRLNEAEVSTGIDDFFVIGTEFTAEDIVGGGGAVDSGVRLIDVRLQNDKATVY